MSKTVIQLFKQCDQCDYDKTMVYELSPDETSEQSITTHSQDFSDHEHPTTISSKVNTIHI